MYRALTRSYPFLFPGVGEHFHEVAAHDGAGRKPTDLPLVVSCQSLSGMRLGVSFT